jgi:hypothetical protein
MDQPLFPLSALKTEGYAQPEPRDDETVADEAAAVDDTEAEAA